MTNEPRTVFKIRLPREGRNLLMLCKAFVWLVAIIVFIALAQWRFCVNVDPDKTIKECLLP